MKEAAASFLHRFQKLEKQQQSFLSRTRTRRARLRRRCSFKSACVRALEFCIIQSSGAFIGAGDAQGGGYLRRLVSSLLALISRCAQAKQIEREICKTRKDNSKKENSPQTAPKHRQMESFSLEEKQAESLTRAAAGGRTAPGPPTRLSHKCERPQALDHRRPNEEPTPNRRRWKKGKKEKRKKEKTALKTHER